MASLILLLLFLPLWFSALFVALTFPLAWLVFPGGGSRGPQDTLASRLAGGLLVLGMEWVATCWVVLAFPYRNFKNRGPRRRLPAGRVPVALVPGHSENALSLFFLERRLDRALRLPVRSFSPGRYYGSLEKIAEAFAGQILEWMGEIGAERIDLVGHSQGGLVARLLAEGGPLKGKVRKVVTLGTPHLGSALAVLLPGRNARQMRRGSAFLERLNERKPPRGVDFTGICSTHDNLILPWHCGLSPRGDNFILRYRGHLTLLMSPEVVRLVARELIGE
jgi:triacylglycerol esterase/lipase EstA (alpha/beta hydrolase family)